MEGKIIFKKLKKSLLILGHCLSSIWGATLSIMILVAYSIIITALMSYYKDVYGLLSIDIRNFIMITYVLIENWKLFWLAFFGTKLYSRLRFLE